jgi:uncharacterized protein YchJ
MLVRSALGVSACSAIPFRPALLYFVPPATTTGLSRARRPVWQSTTNSSTNFTAFETTSKRRKGYPSETRVKRGVRVVHGDRELVEKLGRNDLCPCGSGRRFQALLPRQR